MSFTLPSLPFDTDALAPHIGAETVSIHHGKHHRGYVDKLNDALDGQPEAGSGLTELVVSLPPGSTFNFAAQAWNHAFYWDSLEPAGGGAPRGELASQVAAQMGDAAALKQALAEAANGEFGSGWAWLCVAEDGRLSVLSTTDAENPLRSGLTPLLTIDVWEHAYYLDYQNDRGGYLESLLDHLVNWNFAEENYERWRSGRSER